MTPAVITLTLNPAIDVSGEVGQMLPAHKLRCQQVRRDPGGGGINVARVLYRLGADILAVFPSAGASGKSLERLLAAEGVPSLALPVAGETRENLTVQDKATGLQYRFVFPGEKMAAGDVEKCCDTALDRLSAGGFLVASGSLPPGAAPRTYADLARRVGLAGGSFVLDASGESLRSAFDAPLAILKVSERELMEGLDLNGRSELLAGARRLIARGPRLVAVTSGESGALLVGAGFAYRAEAPRIQTVTSVGAGDSFLGGLVFEFARKRPPDVALQTAVAAGAAALLSPGTSLCNPGMVDALKKQICVHPIGGALATVGC